MLWWWKLCTKSGGGAVAVVEVDVWQCSVHKRGAALATRPVVVNYHSNFLFRY